jgi:hypothetical protein
MNFVNLIGLQVLVKARSSCLLVPPTTGQSAGVGSGMASLQAGPFVRAFSEWYFEVMRLEELLALPQLPRTVALAPKSVG